MNNIRKIASVALSTAVVMSSFVPVFAANRDIQDKNTNEIIKFVEYATDTDKLLELFFDGEIKNYNVEVGGKFYDASQVNEKMGANTELTLEEAVQDLTPVDPEEEGLKVVEVSAINAKKLEVKFSQEVNKAAAETVGNYELIGLAPGVTVTPVLQDDNKTVVLTLSATTANNTTFVVTVKPIASKADANEKTELYTKTLKFSDTVKPTLVDVKYPQAGKAVLNFSEELSIPGTVKVLANGEEVTLTSAPALTSDAKGIELIGLEANKEYTVVVLGAKDMSNNLINPNPIEVTVKSTVVDEVKPEVVSIESVGLDTLKVKFSEALQATASNYLTVAGVTSTVQTFDAKTNTVTVTHNAVTAGVISVKISAYKDLAGNIGEDFTQNVVFKDIVATLEKTEVVTEGTDTFVKLTFNTAMTKGGSAAALAGTVITPENVSKDITPISASDYNLDGADSKIVKIKVTGYEAGKYEITIAKTTDLTNLAKDLKVTFDLEAAVDTTVPVATLGTITNETVTVTYQLDMGQSALDVANYTVSGNKVFEEAIFKGDKKTVELTLKEGAIKYDGDYEFAISTSVKAENGVALKEVFTETKAFKENVAPKVKKAELVGGEKIKVTFSEVIESYTADPFEVYVGGEKVAIESIVEKDNGGSEDFIEITITTALEDLSKDIVVKFAKKAELKDANGNTLVPEASYAVEK